jgi:hypothetical protein
MAENHLDVVQAVKAELEAQRADLSGACGAFKILNRVANRLNAGQPLDDHQRPPWGLLLKAGGNRAVPQMDGSCLNGDQTNAPGYATDYLIERGTWFGFDILGDGGGANNPQWGDPEIDPAMVERNRQNFRPPVLEGLPPELPLNPAQLTEKVKQLEAALILADQAIKALTIRVAALEQDNGPNP